MSTAKPDSSVLRALHPRIIVAFDFDETLAPNTTDALLEHLGVDPQTFRNGEIAPREADGWESRLAEADALLELSRSDRGPISESVFREVGQAIELYQGVPGMFGRVRDAVAELDEVTSVEFHLITAGFVHVPAFTQIADEFTTIIGSHWDFGPQREIRAVKNTVGHYDKVRHLKALAKGLESVQSDRDRDVDAYLGEEEWHAPYEQIVFVGDGDSDLPAFDLLQSNGGTAIAVHQAPDNESWESRGDMRRGRQVMALARSDFSEGSDLMRALELAARRAAARVALLRVGRD